MTAGAQKRVCLGAFAGAHGVKGDVKVKTFTADPAGLVAYGPVETEDSARRFTLKFIRMLKPDLALVRASGIATREDAAALAGARLYVERAKLLPPGEDEFYMDDLVGLAAVDETGAPVGVVAAAYNFGAGDLVEVKDMPDRKGSIVLPFTRETAPEIDLAAGRIVIARAALGDDAAPSLSDETGEIVSTDIDVDLAAMREEDA